METDNCQDESYYECIASQLDKMELEECSNKCIPNTLSILGSNYSTPFCQEDTKNEYCVLEIVQKILTREIASNCKTSCSTLEYLGDVELSAIPVSSSDKGGNWNMYNFAYRLTNQDYESMVYEEYFIYDTVDMIASVGGTLG